MCRVLTMQKKIFYSHNHFKADISMLAHDIIDRGLPDVIVGIARGGLVAATYLSHALDVPMVPASWSTRDGRTNKNIPYDHIKSFGSRILVVDDIIDSGLTLQQILDDFAKNAPTLKVSCATLWQNTDAPIVAEYYMNEISRANDDSWIVFDWEK